jgi:hypothetical protein
VPGSRPPWPRVDGRRPCRVGPGPAAPATLDRSHVRSAKPARPGRGAAGMSELQVSSQLGPCLARPVADREVERDQRQHLVERSERGPAGPCLPRADGRGRDAEPTSESSLTPPASTANEPNEIGGLHAVNPGRSRRGHERDFGVLWTHGALVHLSRPRMSNCPRSVGDRDARDRVPTTGCRPPDADHRMPTTGCRPPAADHRLPTTGCRRWPGVAAGRPLPVGRQSHAVGVQHPLVAGASGAHCSWAVRHMRRTSRVDRARSRRQRAASTICTDHPQPVRAAVLATTATTNPAASTPNAAACSVDCRGPRGA